MHNLLIASHRSHFDQVYGMLIVAVYGESGAGPLNESGAPEFAVVPVFKVEA